MAQPWRTDKWFVSPWNYTKEVTNQFEFPKKIKVHDTSLRDGEQQAGVEFTKDDKVRLAVNLAEAGVHRIEAGMPVASKYDELAIKEIVKLNLGIPIFAFSRCMISDVERAVDCGVDGVIIEMGCSKHILENAYCHSLEWAIEHAIEATNFAHEQGLYVSFFPVDSSRADMNWYLDFVRKVNTDGYMDALVVVDTYGVLLPPAVIYIVKRLREQIKKPLEAHFHNDFGMAVANTLAALSAGAEVAHTTVSGIGERSGNTPMEETVVALLTLYGIDTGIDTKKLCKLSKMVQYMVKHQIPANRAIVGRALFDVESGIPVSWMKNCLNKTPTVLFPLHWDLLGRHAPKVVLGKSSGRDSIVFWLDKIGHQKYEKPDIDNILLKVIDKSYQKKGLLTRMEFEEIVNTYFKDMALLH
ncbi:MAG: pyruvate carboxyltransferase [Dehalococcoidia bacterium]|nr:pyruvate carboxyltransferase [Dehalococcoidia bacterium]